MIIKLSPSESTQITLIHQEALKGDFLPSLGFNFLKTFYLGILPKEDVYGFGFIEEGKIVGFVVGTLDSESFFKMAIKSKFIPLSAYLIIELIKKPWLMKNVLETFLYTSKDKGPKAELVVIAVSENFQGKGIGKKLTESLEEAFLKNRIYEYKLTVHADKKAVQFYEHLKYNRISEFNLYAKLWYVYAKKIKKYGKASRKK